MTQIYVKILSATKSLKNLLSALAIFLISCIYLIKINIKIMNTYNFLLFAITFLLIIGCKESTQVETNIDLEGMLNITKTEVGFNIYSNRGILILEFTKQNCDNTSLETLDYIYETVIEFYDMELPKAEKRIQTIKGI